MTPGGFLVCHSAVNLKSTLLQLLFYAPRRTSKPFVVKLQDVLFFLNGKKKEVFQRRRDSC